jgi:hypothetical protein
VEVSCSKLTLYGELAGKGIQKGVAVAQINPPIFCIFAIQIDSQLMIEPEQITALVTKKGAVKPPSWMYVLPWFTEYP